MRRRELLKYGIGGLATIVMGNRLPWLQNAYAATQGLQVTITDALKGMVTDNLINSAKCYFWIYKMSADGVDIPAECPGPIIVATAGDTINISVTNSLDEPHAFFIPGIVDSGPIAPNGGTWSDSFIVPTAGAFLYYDNLNEPVNRLMGLHGALVVMPAAAVAEHHFTPYDPALVTPGVQQLYNEHKSFNFSRRSSPKSTTDGKVTYRFP